MDTLRVAEPKEGRNLGPWRCHQAPELIRSGATLPLEFPGGLTHSELGFLFFAAKRFLNDIPLTWELANRKEGKHINRTLPSHLCCWEGSVLSSFGTCARQPG